MAKARKTNIEFIVDAMEFIEYLDSLPKFKGV